LRIDEVKQVERPGKFAFVDGSKDQFADRIDRIHPKGETGGFDMALGG
jgi:hypothetical protein